MQFSTKIDGFEQKDSQGFENSYNSYEQYPLENFFIFTIYQNYTLALRNTGHSYIIILTQHSKISGLKVQILTAYCSFTDFQICFFKRFLNNASLHCTFKRMFTNVTYQDTDVLKRTIAKHTFSLTTQYLASVSFTVLATKTQI